MSENSEEPKDLLGEPYRPLPDKRGRRKLRFEPQVYDRVEELKAAGTSPKDIATALGISEPSLRKYFFPELRDGAARQKAEALSLLISEAKKGKVAAIKAWLQILDKGEAAPPVARERATRAPALGKKEAANEAALTAHNQSSWGEVLKH